MTSFYLAKFLNRNNIGSVLMIETDSDLPLTKLISLHTYKTHQRVHITSALSIDKLLKIIKHAYNDYIIIDTHNNNHINKLTKVAIAQSDMVICLSTLDNWGTVGLGLAVNTITDYNPVAPVYIIINTNRFEESGQRALIEQIRRQPKITLMRPFIPKIASPHISILTLIASNSLPRLSNTYQQIFSQLKF